MLPRHFAVLTDDDFIFSLFVYVSPLSLCCLEQVNVDLRNSVQRYKSVVFNIGQHLFRFFSSPEDFRKLQAETGALISGSNALQFLLRQTFPLSDLDLYVTQDNHERVADWLTQQDGYIVASTPPQHQHYYGSNGIFSVVQLEKTRVDGTIACVQLIVCSSCPLNVILSFHSSRLLFYECL